MRSGPLVIVSPVNHCGVTPTIVDGMPSTASVRPDRRWFAMKGAPTSFYRLKTEARVCHRSGRRAYSVRSAVSGSTDAARQAGTRLASSAVAPSIHVTPA
jgi:hypothetical protein